MTQAATPVTGASRFSRALRRQARVWARHGALFVAGLIGLLLVAALFGSSPWSWLLWIGVGLLVGAMAGSGRLVWLAWSSVLAFYPVSLALGLTERLGPFWFLGAAIGAGLVSVGFAIGVPLARGRDPWARNRSAWRAIRPVWRRLIVVAIALGLMGLAVYTAYVGAAGAAEFVRPAARQTDCRTPAGRYGWEYEAINYDKLDDLTLKPRLTTDEDGMPVWVCPTQGAVAGDEVVTSDGIRIAGWYIPAASGIGPSGPTVVIVHGWKANKSEALKYAPPFHDTFNLVLVDLRNGGRSSDTDTTMGVREQLDVEAMIDWLARTKHPTWLGAMGNSMGAATALAAAASDPRIEALILDSAHARFVVSTGNGLETEYGHPSLPGSWAIAGGVSLRIGADVTAIDPVRTIARMGDRPVLLIHGTGDLVDRPSESAEVNLHAALVAGVPVELHYCPGATHGRVIDTCPDEWARWAVSFMTAAAAR
jgi:pimeloyl-ACP methyl ester carboxylesterase